MIKGQELIEELGFKMPKLTVPEENALEIFFIDKYGTIHGRFGWESIRWSKKGVSSTHPDNFNLVKVNWYDIPSNFPCLIKNSASVIRITTKCHNSKVMYETGGWDEVRTVVPITLEEASKLIIKEGKC